MWADGSRCELLIYDEVKDVVYRKTYKIRYTK